MALKPTIYKAKLAVSDLNRHYFETLQLTIALHPSETLERMMARLLAFCLNANENLSFTRGLSSVDEPDIIARSLSDAIELWIEVGEPAPERIKKATRVAQQVKVYSFNSKSAVWWEQSKAKFNELKLDVVQFEWPAIQALAAMAERTMDFTLTISDDTAYFSTDANSCEVKWVELKKREC